MEHLSEQTLRDITFHIHGYLTSSLRSKSVESGYPGSIARNLDSNFKHVQITEALVKQICEFNENFSIVSHSSNNREGVKWIGPNIQSKKRKPVLEESDGRLAKIAKVSTHRVFQVSF